MLTGISTKAYLLNVFLRKRLRNGHSSSCDSSLIPTIPSCSENLAQRSRTQDERAAALVDPKALDGEGVGHDITVHRR